MCRQAPGKVLIVAWSPWSRFGTGENGETLIPAMGVLAGGEEGVGEFQGVKSYLWVALLSVGGDQRGAGGGSRERRLGTSARRTKGPAH